MFYDFFYFNLIQYAFSATFLCTIPIFSRRNFVINKKYMLVNNAILLSILLDRLKPYHLPITKELLM